MYIKKRNRKFIVGNDKDIILKDVGSIYLKDNENLTIQFNKNTEYDVAKKNWGFYCIPSINKRLVKYNLRTALVQNTRLKTYFIMLINDKKIKIFKNYCKKEDLKLICWLNEKNLEKIKKYFKH